MIPGVIIAVLIAALTAAVLIFNSQGRKTTPLESSALASAEAGLEGTLVLEMANAVDVAPPFALRESPVVRGGLVLVLPEDKGSSDAKGRARIKFNVESDAVYHLWARVRWADECGNSVALAIDEDAKAVTLQDSSYGTWHWLSAGRRALSAGEHSLSVLEREDGIELAQVLLTPNAQLRPSALGTLLGGGSAERRFADDFMRSPGHGLGSWQVVSGDWDIAFTADPNRVPNQYALVGRAGDGEALAVVDGPPWNGCRLSFNVNPGRTAAFGAVLDRTEDGGPALRIEFELADSARTVVRAGGGGIDEQVEVPDLFVPGQWHRVTVERWAWTVRVTVDGRTVLTGHNAAPAAGAVGLLVRSGEVVFDDVDAAGILWQADDGRDFKMAWSVPEGTDWYRPAGGALGGRDGAITASWPGLPVAEVLLEEMPAHAGACRVRAPALEVVKRADSLRVLRRPASVTTTADAVAFEAPGKEVELARVAVRYGQPALDRCVIGTYGFETDRTLAPFDYYEFTPEEVARMSKDAKDKRKPVVMPMLGSDRSPWVLRSGRWRILGGVLLGTGPGAELKHGQETVGNLSLRMRFRLLGPASAAEVQLYAGPGAGARLRLAGRSVPPPATQDDAVRLGALAHDIWHELTVVTRGGELSVQLDGGKPAAARFDRGCGGRILLKVPAGAVEFDDIEISVPRSTQDGALYAFDRREPDWLCEGESWLDHGGVSCVYTSSWISLVAPQGAGMLWNKRDFGPDALVTFTVNANTAWFGWDKNPSHVHYPYDNIRIVLGSERSPDRGYRLELNSRGRTATVLYRNGKEVAAVTQDAGFPMRYVGQHAPYNPRKNRIALAKCGPRLWAIVNGREVLSYTDPAPLEVSTVGIGGYDTRINFSDVEVRRMPPADARPDTELH